MSNTIENVIGKFDEGRTWSMDGFSCRKLVEIQKNSVEHEWEVVIFTLPYKYLRPGATSFCDFRKDPESMAFQEVFTFYIDLITRMSSAKPMPKDCNCVTFLETVLNDAGAAVAVRIFFFCNRAQVRASTIVREMLEAHSKDDRRKTKTDCARMGKT